MNILIVGNGFDLEHELPTKYWDFLQCMKLVKRIKEDNITRENIENILDTEVEFRNINHNLKRFILRNSLYCHDNVLIEELFNLVEENIWLEYFLQKKDCQDKGWIDFESEIATVIKALEYTNERDIRLAKFGGRAVYDSYFMRDYDVEAHSDNFLKVYNQKTRDIHIEYGQMCGADMKKFISNLNIDLLNLIRCLEIYIIECVDKVNVLYRATDIEEIEVDKLLSFNYSDTYSKLYYNGMPEYDYIHGYVELGREKVNNNMVLGIDEYLEDNKKDIVLDFILFKKYFQRIFKKTGCIYKKWLHNITENKMYGSNVYIFGHSLDVTDKDIFKEIILNDCITTTIFYYNEESHMQLIINLVKIIGQDQLTSKVFGNRPTIIFKKQKERRRIES